MYKQYFCSILSIFVVLCENRYNQQSYFWYYRPIIIDQFTLKDKKSRYVRCFLKMNDLVTLFKSGIMRREGRILCVKLTVV